jgi:hypothetical protein
VFFAPNGVEGPAVVFVVAFVSRALKGHDFTGCGKAHSGLQEVSGHDFSRAVTATK